MVEPGIYFHEGDPRRRHSNNGWVVFDDYVVVIDANCPSGAQEVLPKIKASSSKPIRFVVDTHHHADHAYGNELWAEEGATLIAHTRVLAALRSPNAITDWEISAKKRPDESKPWRPRKSLAPKSFVRDTPGEVTPVRTAC